MWTIYFGLLIWRITILYQVQSIGGMAVSKSRLHLLEDHQSAHLIWCHGSPSQLDQQHEYEPWHWDGGLKKTAVNRTMQTLCGKFNSKPTCLKYIFEKSGRTEADVRIWYCFWFTGWIPILVTSYCFWIIYIYNSWAVPKSIPESSFLGDALCGFCQIQKKGAPPVYTLWKIVIK